MKKGSVSLVVLMGILFLSASATFLMPSVKHTENSVEQLRTSAGEITIVSPENKTYTEPDSGYYPATYGFEDVEDGSFPSYMINDNAAPVTVEGTKNGHNKVLRFDDSDSKASLHGNFNQNVSSGTIECWYLIDDATDRGGFHVRQGPTFVVFFTSRYEKWKFTAPGQSDVNIQRAIGGDMPSPLDNTWHHVSIDFECSSGNYEGLDQYTWKCRIDGVESAVMPFNSNQDYIDNMEMGTSFLHSYYNVYIDAIGCSWDSNYDIGDNLNEGLLLSYENSTSLDWQGYSLDGGVNKTILGNTTIPMPSDGIHSIQVFGNDSLGDMYESDLRYFTTNALGPEININSPISNQLFGITPPDFSLSIPDSDVIFTYYSLDGGTTNIPFSGFTGTIEQFEWGYSDQYRTSRGHGEERCHHSGHYNCRAKHRRTIRLHAHLRNLY